MTRVAISPDILIWARQRSRIEHARFESRFPMFNAWASGETRPTLKQVEAFAKATHTPMGFLFLEHPPEERVPIPDFRTIADQRLSDPSPDLLDTIYLCQQRQDWYREYSRASGYRPLPFVGTLNVSDEVTDAAATIRTALGFDLDERRRIPTWTDALRRFIELADALGVLVMVSGVVGSSNTRKLDTGEFRGFVLVDEFAPLIFINGADTKAAQMFTLAHELAHIWLGQTALSDAQAKSAPEHEIERWCNKVAAELLVPLKDFRREYQPGSDLYVEFQRLAKVFKVSTLVILRRLHDIEVLNGNAYWEAYESERARLQSIPRGNGGNFYLTLGARSSKRFARALVVSALEGRSTFTEAFRLLGFKKMSTFKEVGRSLGFEF